MPCLREARKRAQSTPVGCSNGVTRLCRRDQRTPARMAKGRQPLMNSRWWGLTQAAATRPRGRPGRKVGAGAPSASRRQRTPPALVGAVARRRRASPAQIAGTATLGRRNTLTAAWAAPRLRSTTYRRRWLSPTTPHRHRCRPTLTAWLFLPRRPVADRDFGTVAVDPFYSIPDAPVTQTTRYGPGRPNPG